MYMDFFLRDIHGDITLLDFGDFPAPNKNLALRPFGLAVEAALAPPAPEKRMWTTKWMNNKVKCGQLTQE